MSKANQSTFDWNEATKEAENREFVEFDDEGEVTVKFEENDPFWTGIPKDSKFNSTSYMFNVEALIDGEATPAVFSTSSKRCMKALGALRPLKNKTVLISKTGEGIDTQYKAEKL